MLRTKVKRRVFAAAIAATSIVGFSISSMADGHKVLDSIHFLIPGGAGGGWGSRRRFCCLACLLASLLASIGFWPA